MPFVFDQYKSSERRAHRNSLERIEKVGLQSRQLSRVVAHLHLPKQSPTGRLDFEISYRIDYDKAYAEHVRPLCVRELHE